LKSRNQKAAIANEPRRNIHDSENSNYNPVYPQLKRSKRNSLKPEGTPEMKNGWAKNEIRVKKQRFFPLV